MGCCGTEVVVPDAHTRRPARSAFGATVRRDEAGRSRLDLLVPGIHCAGCIGRIERAVGALPGVEAARVNFTLRRLAVTFEEATVDADEIAAAVTGLGYEVKPFSADPDAIGAGDETLRRLARAMAVAGFAAANVMLLSVSIWAGASDATRDLFHWISAMIALPAVVYAGRPFYASAFRALKARSLNMDVPIALAVVLAAGMSLYETATGGAYAWFDASVTLLFFLLAGRFLDHMMRARARNAVTHLVSQGARAALVVTGEGDEWVPVASVVPGMVVRVAAGERVPVDGTVEAGASDLDRSLITGESVPQPTGAGDIAHAGTMNLTGPLTIRVTAAGEDTFLAEIARLMAAAETGRARYVRIADRAARIYAPAVHILAALAFLGWFAATGDAHHALVTAIAVLIITCPCALGLAVPAVQVVAAGMLFARGIMVKDGAALERLAEIDTIVFDKTGTLTLGEPQLVGPTDTGMMALAAGLAAGSTHPLSRALARAAAAAGIAPAVVTDVSEVPGAGLEGRIDGAPVRLGRRDWCGKRSADPAGADLEIVLAVGGRERAAFRFRDRLRPDAAETVEALQGQGYAVAILSGDREPVVAATAAALGVGDWRAGCSPADKVAAIAALGATGRKVLVVGDGLNDGPALAAGHASMAPGSASDLGRTAADLVFLGGNLGAVAAALAVSRRALSHVRQNFALAVAYNLVAVPIAIAGLATPLIAALAMSSSSIVVIANALRLRLFDPRNGRRSSGSASPAAGKPPSPSVPAEAAE